MQLGSLDGDTWILLSGISKVADQAIVGVLAGETVETTQTDPLEFGKPLLILLHADPDFCRDFFLRGRTPKRLLQRSDCVLDNSCAFSFVGRNPVEASQTVENCAADSKLGV